MNGSLQIKNGYYYTVICKEVNGIKKPVWKSTGLKVKGNKKEAEKILNERIRESELNNNIDSNIMFSDYIVNWLSFVENKIDSVTYLGYLSIANAHIIPYFKAKKIELRNLELKHIQIYIDYKSKNGRLDNKGGLSPKTMKAHKNIINLVCKYALKNKLISKNPCEFVVLPKQVKREVNFYTLSELKNLFNVISNEYLYPLIYITVIFGLRREEVLGLKWDSVNFENETVTIKHTVVCYDKKVFQKDSTKNDSSFRSFPLLPEVKEILLSLKAQEQENKRLFGKSYNNNDYIFKWQDGTPFNPNYITRKWSKLLSQYNLRHIRFHDLRHSCASLLVSLGFTIKDIQEWLGHSDIQTTANIYAHLSADRKNNIANTITSNLKF